MVYISFFRKTWFVYLILKNVTLSIKFNTVHVLKRVCCVLLESNAGSRPRQLRPRPKAPQQITNFLTKKSPHLS